MKSYWDEEARRELRSRFGLLTPQSKPGWGRMSAPEMVTHVADSLRMALGELSCAPRPSLLRYTPVKQLVVYWLPWPKGVPTAPELLARVPASWSADLADLTSLMERLAARGRGGPFADHPAFGTMSGRTWGALVYRHLDHHLKQFGI